MQLPVQLLRKPDTHKGHYGHILILGGSPGLTGAVCLSARAALRIGVGLVTTGVPKTLNNIFEVKLTEAMSLPLADSKGYLTLASFKEIKKFLPKIDVIVVGPGVSAKQSVQKLVTKVVKDIDKPMVIDADGITALASNLSILSKRKSRHLVLTPHFGEFSRLVKLNTDKIKKARKELVKKFSLRYNLTLVLKGHHTLVSNGNRFFVNNTGNPGMATAGSGDVLSGVIAGLISQGLSCFEAARVGVYLHGLAGDFAAQEKSENCLIASDIIENLPKAVKRLIRKA